MRSIGSGNSKVNMWDKTNDLLGDILTIISGIIEKLDSHCWEKEI